MSSDKASRAAQHFRNHRNCAQSVFSVFSTDFGLDEDNAISIASAFGGGLAHTQRTCGVITGSLMAIGLALYDHDSEPGIAKTMVYDHSLDFMNQFRELHKSLECRTLLGADMHTEEGQKFIADNDLYENRCERFIDDAVKIVERMIGQRQSRD